MAIRGQLLSSDAQNLPAPTDIDTRRRFRRSWLGRRLTPCWAGLHRRPRPREGDRRGRHILLRSRLHSCRIRALHNAARSAVKARTAALNQIGSILVSAPEAIRAKYSPLKSTDRADALARLRPAGDTVHTAVLTALKTLARPVKELTAEHEALTKALDTAVTAGNRRPASRSRSRPRHRRTTTDHAGGNPNARGPGPPSPTSAEPAGSPPPAAEPTATASPEAATGPPTPPSTASPWSA